MLNDLEPMVLREEGYHDAGRRSGAVETKGFGGSDLCLAAVLSWTLNVAV